MTENPKDFPWSYVVQDKMKLQGKPLTKMWNKGFLAGLYHVDDLIDKCENLEELRGLLKASRLAVGGVT